MGGFSNLCPNLSSFLTHSQQNGSHQTTPSLTVSRAHVRMQDYSHRYEQTSVPSCTYHSLYFTHMLMYACKTRLLTVLHSRAHVRMQLMYACKTRLLTVLYSRAHVCMQDKTTHCTLLTCSCTHARQDYSLYFTHMLMYACKTHPVMTKQFTVTARTVSTRGFAGVSRRVITCTSPSPSIR